DRPDPPHRALPGEVLAEGEREALHDLLAARAEALPGKLALLEPRQRALELARGQLAGELEELLLGLELGHPRDLTDLGPGDAALIERPGDQGELLEPPREEDELVGVLDPQVHLRPPGGLEGLAQAAPLHVQEVEAQRALGDLSLALVELEPLHELLPGKTGD